MNNYLEPNLLRNILPIRIVKSNVWSVDPRQIETVSAVDRPFIFQFVSLLCLRSTLRLIYLERKELRLENVLAIISKEIVGELGHYL